jgi:hypothetical protein
MLNGAKMGLETKIDGSGGYGRMFPHSRFVFLIDVLLEIEWNHERDDFGPQSKRALKTTKQSMVVKR